MKDQKSLAHRIVELPGYYDYDVTFSRQTGVSQVVLKFDTPQAADAFARTMRDAEEGSTDQPTNGET
jgi:hypothetical protein